MSVSLAQPLGLLALLSLPVIFWLHQYVLRGPVRQVSNLALWSPRDDAMLEGATRTRPPPTPVLWLELAAAALLSLVLAGFDVTIGAQQQRHVGLVIDGSASMAGGRSGATPLERAVEALDDVDASDTRVSIVAARARPELIGEARMTVAEARGALATLEPSGAQVRLGPALEMLSGLGVSPASVLIVSDDPALQHRQLWRVGSAADNAGMTSARWRPGQAPFVAVRRFDDQPRTLQLRVTIDDDPEAVHSVDLGAHAEAPLSFPVPPDADRIELVLPDDGLALDNRITLLAPPARQVSVHNGAETPALARAVDRLIAAVPLLQAAGADEAVLDIGENVTAPGSGRWVLSFDQDEAEPRWAGTLTADPFSPLAAGLDTHGLTWAGPAREPAAGSQAILLDAEHPVLWKHGTVLRAVLDVGRSNLLSHSAFPILLSNLAAEIDRSAGGLRQRNFLQGQRLVLRRAGDWRGPVTWSAPDGSERTFTADEHTFDLGTLSAAGLHRMKGEGFAETFSVAFIDGRESNLGLRAAPNARPELHAELSRDRDDRTRARPWLLLLAALLAAAAYWLLLRGRTP